MLILLFFSCFATLTLAAKCPTGISFVGGIKDFGPWHADPSQKCSFALSMSQNMNKYFETVEITIANIGPSDNVTISSGNGNIQLTNRKMYQETFFLVSAYHIHIDTGANTQLVMEFDACLVDINPVENPCPVQSVELMTSTRSYVLYLNEFPPKTAFTFTGPETVAIQQMVIQKAEIVNDPADLIQWSNVLIYHDKDAIGSIFDLLGNTDMFISEGTSITLYLTAPINFKGAILITTALNVKKFSNHGLVYANPALPSQSLTIGNANAAKSYVTVIGDRDQSTPITIRTASPATLSVTNRGPDSKHDISLLLNQLPLQMSGNMWTFYSNQGSGMVKFSVEP